MVQPKYSPEEALQKIKLMMKYDSSKTLTENKITIDEAAPLLLGFIPTAVPWLVTYGAIAVSGIVSWINGVTGGGNSFEKTKKFFEGCSSQDNKLKPLQDKNDHREAANLIYEAIEGIGTNLPAIKSALSSMRSIADLCAMHKQYSFLYGDLYDDLDSDIDGEDFTKYVWSAIGPTIMDAETQIENVQTPEKQNDKGPVDKKTTKPIGTKYIPCSGTYYKTCYSPVIEKVQRCLGFTGSRPYYIDGKFGPTTAAALKAKGYTTFTDADVNKICGGTEVTVDSEISGEEYTDFNTL
jgi:hypothetical protein